MELFTIDCTTCRAHLKVHGPEVIGQILACPRCASMVRVTPPVGWTIPISNGDTTPVRHVGPPPLPKRQSRIESPGPPPLPKRNPAHVVVRAQRPHARDVQFWLPIASACMAGVVLGLSVWLLTTMHPGQTKTEEVASAESGAMPVAFPTDPEAQQVVVNRPAIAPDATPAKPSQTPAAAQAAPLHGAPSPTRAHPAAPADVHPKVSAPPPTTAIASATPKAAAPSPGTNLKLTEATTHGIVLTEGAAPPATAAAGKPAVPVKPTFDLDARLADKLPAIDFQKMPLQLFVRTMTDYSTIPIGIDEEALGRAGKNAKVAVSVKLSAATVAEALKAALEPEGLVFRKAKDRVVITTAEPHS